ncbi:hypothetical protein JR316_0012468 [Psilocybe cubensis]|uniref:Uncharacterized protein n=2 Tax=Psilocybe cubensis TaxID=181762 RepID=A0A8H7XQL5_PSICU|nr:hypothetical protein JR316_0012468 [Psilocybe cubensis]KAH9475357.1 hypothetical protein JR316_0012468 [Psilocybe cubensis]
MSSIKTSWSDPNTYKNDPTTKAKCEQAVKSASETTSAVKRGATDAIIKGGIHQSPSDSKNHLTVEYKKNGTHVTTKHVHT